MTTETTTPEPAAPSGFRVREIKTKTVTDEQGTRIVPELDEHGKEIEIHSIDVPQHVESEGAESIDAHVLEQLTTPGLAVDVVDVAENPPTVDEGGES